MFALFIADLLATRTSNTY